MMGVVQKCDGIGCSVRVESMRVYEGVESIVNEKGEKKCRRQEHHYSESPWRPHTPIRYACLPNREPQARSKKERERDTPE